MAMNADPCTWRENPIAVKLLNSLENKFLTDVTFIVGGKEFQAHKFILSLASPVYQKQFYGGLHGVVESKPIQLTDVTADVFSAFLTYIYTDDLDFDVMMTGDVLMMLNLADHHIMWKLERAVVEELEFRLTDGNALWIFNSLFISNEYLTDMEDLREACLNIFINETQTILNSEEGLSMGKGMLRTIVQQYRLSISDLDLWNWLYGWGKRQCLKNGVKDSDENVRLQLSGIIEFVRFLAMDRSDFTNGPAQTNVLTDKEKCEIYHLMCTTGRPKDRFYYDSKLSSNSAPVDDLTSLDEDFYEGYRYCTNCHAFHCNKFVFSKSSQPPVALCVFCNDPTDLPFKLSNRYHCRSKEFLLDHISGEHTVTESNWFG